MPPETMHREIYDLLGYGSLTHEVVDYLMAMLGKNDEFAPLSLFERLHDFYLRWWNGEFIDVVETNWPRLKMASYGYAFPSEKSH